MEHDKEATLELTKEDGKFTDRVQGLIVLLTVPLAWGTYTPAVRYLYEIKPAIPGFLFSAAYYGVASLTLNGLLLASKDDGSNGKQKERIETKSQSFLNLPIQGGWELGTYLFIGNALQIIGLKTVPSDRAGFLVQLTTVMVPLMEAIFKGNMLAVSIRTWVACILAFAGVVVMGFDGQEGSIQVANFLSVALTSFSPGDLYIVSAASVYTLHVVRLGKYAQETSALSLAAAKSSAEAVLSCILVSLLVALGQDASVGDIGVLGYAKEAGQEISNFFTFLGEGFSSGSPLTMMNTLLPGIFAVLWTGWVTCAYTIYAQSFGQKRLRPSEANLIYTIQPLFTSLFAWILLKETLGPSGIVGGMLIASGVIAVAAADPSSESNE